MLQDSFLSLTLDWYIAEMMSSNISSSAPLIVMHTLLEGVLMCAPFNESSNYLEAVKHACLQTQVNVIKGMYAHSRYIWSLKF